MFYPLQSLRSSRRRTAFRLPIIVLSLLLMAATGQVLAQGGDGGGNGGGVGSQTTPLSVHAQIDRGGNGVIQAFTITQSGFAVGADTFFTKYAADFGIGPQHAHLARTLPTDSLGYTQFRFSQEYKGVPVVDREYILTERTGTVVSGIGHFLPNLQETNFSVTPTVSQNTARQAAMSEVLRKVPNVIFPWEGTTTSPPKGTLIIVPDPAPALSFRFSIPTTGNGSYSVDVNAKTGMVIQTFSTTQEYNEQHVTVNVDSFYAGNVPLTVFQSSTDPQNLQVTRTLALQPTLAHDIAGPTLETKCLYDDQGGNFVIVPFDDLDGDSVFQDTNPLDPQFPCQSIYGADVHFGVQYSLNYFKNTFGWVGWDGVGQQPIRAFVGFVDEHPENNFGKSYAFYSADNPVTGPEPFIFFNALQPNPAKYLPAVDIDATAHEVTHGIHIAAGLDTGIVSNCSDERALGEGMAQLFGLLIKNDWRASKGLPFVWTKAEGFSASFTPDVDYSAPLLYGYPDTYKQGPYEMNIPDDGCEPHKNGAVFDHWFYLLVTGKLGNNFYGESVNLVAISQADAGKIAFRTMTQKSVLGMDYSMMRYATLQSAEELFGLGSQQYISVMNAWHAVGVGGPWTALPTFSPQNGTVGFLPWLADLSFEPKFPAAESAWIIEVSPDPTFDPSVSAQSPEITQVFVQGNKFLVKMQFALDGNTPYYWRTKATHLVNEDKCTQTQGQRPPVECGILHVWSPTHDFKTNEQKGTTFLPANGAPSVPAWGEKASAQFSVSPVTGATHYAVVLSETPFSTTEATDYINSILNIPVGTIPSSETFLYFLHHGANANPEIFALNLKTNTQYWWAVMPVHELASVPGYYLPGTFSDIATFTTDLPATKLTMPRAMSPWVAYVQWDAVPGATGYTIEASQDTSFTNLLDIGSGSVLDGDTTVYSFSVPVPPGLSQLPPIGPETEPIYVRVTPVGPLLGLYHPLFFQDAGATTEDNAIIDYTMTKPLNLLPPDGAVVTYGAPVDFSWGQTGGAKKFLYEVHIGDLSGITAAANEIVGVNGVTHMTLDDVSFNTSPPTYCWRIQGRGPLDDLGMVSGPSCYDIGPDAPTLSQPPDGDTQVELTPSFSWNSIYAPGGYTLVIKKASDNSLVASVDLAQTATYTPTTPLELGTTYSWYVIGKGPTPQGNQQQLTAQSASATFTTEEAIQAVQLNSPGNGDGEINYQNPIFSWDAAPYAPNGYGLVVQGISSDQSLPTWDLFTCGNPCTFDYSTVTTLEKGETYQWYVITYGTYNQPDAVSDTWVFDTAFDISPDDPPPPPPQGNGGGGQQSQLGYTVLNVSFDNAAFMLEPWLVSPLSNGAYPVDGNGGVITTMYPGSTYILYPALGSIVAGNWTLRLKIKNLDPSVTYDFNNPPVIYVSQDGVSLGTTYVSFPQYIDGQTYYYSFVVSSS